MYETKFMQRVLDLSQQGMQGGHGGPFGCVIVKDGIIVGEAHNEVLSSNDPTAHAELLAVRRASAKLKTFNLSGCELYTNGAPCCMCMSSMLWARVDRAYYVLSMDGFPRHRSRRRAFLRRARPAARSTPDRPDDPGARAQGTGPRRV